MNGDCVMRMSVVFFVIEILEVNMMEIFTFKENMNVLEILGTLSNFCLWLSDPPKLVTTNILTLTLILTLIRETAREIYVKVIVLD